MPCRRLFLANNSFFRFLLLPHEPISQLTNYLTKSCRRQSFRPVANNHLSSSFNPLQPSEDDIETFPK